MRTEIRVKSNESESIWDFWIFLWRDLLKYMHFFNELAKAMNERLVMTPTVFKTKNQYWTNAKVLLF